MLSLSARDAAVRPALGRIGLDRSRRLMGSAQSALLRSSGHLSFPLQSSGFWPLRRQLRKARRHPRPCALWLDAGEIRNFLFRRGVEINGAVLVVCLAMGSGLFGLDGRA